MLKVKGKSEANLNVGNSEVEEVDVNVFKDGGGTSDIRKRIAIASFILLIKLINSVRVLKLKVNQ